MLGEEGGSGSAVVVDGTIVQPQSRTPCRSSRSDVIGVDRVRGREGRGEGEDRSGEGRGGEG